jgi:hypothetical protein
VPGADDNPVTAGQSPRTGHGRPPPRTGPGRRPALRDALAAALRRAADSRHGKRLCGPRREVRPLLGALVPKRVATLNDYRVKLAKVKASSSGTPTTTRRAVPRGRGPAHDQLRDRDVVLGPDRCSWPARRRAPRARTRGASCCSSSRQGGEAPARPARPDSRGRVAI